MPDPVRVIYVLSTAHSGSTLLDLMLGSHTRIESCGEAHTFARYMADDPTLAPDARTCTCGVDVHECEMWREVRSILTRRHGNCLIELEAEDPEEFAQNNYRVFSAVLEASGKDFVCESTKKHHRLWKFIGSDLFDVYVAHIVRDGRAVAHSYWRKGKRTGMEDADKYDFHQALRTWRDVNLRVNARLKDSGRYALVRYEDLVAEPQGNLSRVMKLLGLAVEDGQQRFWEFRHHNLAGNLMRLRGEQEVKRDVEYLQALSTAEWWRATLIGWRCLRQFGYPLCRTRAMRDVPDRTMPC